MGTASVVAKGTGGAHGRPSAAARAALAGGSAPVPAKAAPSTKTPLAPPPRARPSSGADVITRGPEVAVAAPSGTPTTMAGPSALPPPPDEQPVRARPGPAKATMPVATPARMRCDVKMTAPLPAPPWVQRVARAGHFSRQFAHRDPTAGPPNLSRQLAGVVPLVANIP